MISFLFWSYFSQGKYGTNEFLIPQKYIFNKHDTEMPYYIANKGLYLIEIHFINNNSIHSKTGTGLKRSQLFYKW